MKNKQIKETNMNKKHTHIKQTNMNLPALVIKSSFSKQSFV